MADPITITAIVAGVTALSGVIIKLVHSMRNDIKSCFGVQFRTPKRGNTPNSTTPEQVTPTNKHNINNMSSQDLTQIINTVKTMVESNNNQPSTNKPIPPPIDTST